MVEDDGPGIPPHLLNRIFEPFFTTKTGGEGTGLGLSRCREIVEGHGGLIRAENREEGGSRFWVHLPAEHALAKETPIGTLHKMRAQAWDPERDR